MSTIAEETGAPPNFWHKVYHVKLTAETDPNDNKLKVTARYKAKDKDGNWKDGFVRGKGHHGDAPKVGESNGHEEEHVPICIRTLEQESVMWESDVGPFIVLLKDDSPFYRTFPAKSTQGNEADPKERLHRVSSGPIRSEVRSQDFKEVGFAVRFTGASSEAEELDPHIIPWP